MKKELQLTIAIIGMFIGIGLMIWANIIMRNYDGYLEVFKAARRAATPQFITGLLILLVSYVLTYKFKK